VALPKIFGPTILKTVPKIAAIITIDNLVTSGLKYRINRLKVPLKFLAFPPDRPIPKPPLPIIPRPDRRFFGVSLILILLFLWPITGKIQSPDRLHRFLVNFYGYLNQQSAHYQVRLSDRHPSLY